MPVYRRIYQPGGLYFFTLVTHRRRHILTSDLGRDCLRLAMVAIFAARPVDVVASVLLPDHYHGLWRLPPGDAYYSTRIRRIKEEFTRSFLKAGGLETDVSLSRQKRGERGVWQWRFWEHTIAGEDDFCDHMDYIHYNPVKHGYVKCPKDWPYCSFGRWVKAGAYEENWGCASHGELTFPRLNETAME